MDSVPDSESKGPWFEPIGLGQVFFRLRWTLSGGLGTSLSDETINRGPVCSMHLALVN